MPIFAAHKIAFIQIPKTAGTSIVQTFMDAGDEPVAFTTDGHSPQHSTLSELFQRQLIPAHYKIISVVRHPYQRFISEYNYRHAMQGMECDITEFAKLFFSGGEWDNHNLSSTKFLLFKGAICRRVKVIKYANIEHGLLAETGLQLSRREMVVPKVFTGPLPDEVKHKIQKHWRADFVNFGYEV